MIPTTPRGVYCQSLKNLRIDIATMNTVLLSLAILPVIYTLPSAVQVSILTDPSKDGFNVGNYDRTRFDLIESYNPLATASVAKGSDLKASRHFKQRVGGVKNVLNVVTEDADLLGNNVDSLEVLERAAAPAKESVAHGEWLPWTGWSPCVNGQRTRVRGCVSRRAARRIVCEGLSKETQTCFSTEDVNVPVASDPWTIEREINGQMMKLRHGGDA